MTKYYGRVIVNGTGWSTSRCLNNPSEVVDWAEGEAASLDVGLGHTFMWGGMNGVFERRYRTRPTSVDIIDFVFFNTAVEDIDTQNKTNDPSTETEESTMPASTTMTINVERAELIEKLTAKRDEHAAVFQAEIDEHQAELDKAGDFNAACVVYFRAVADKVEAGELMVDGDGNPYAPGKNVEDSDDDVPEFPENSVNPYVKVKLDHVKEVQAHTTRPYDELLAMLAMSKDETVAVDLATVSPLLSAIPRERQLTTKIPRKAR